jgi:hypothetical protein
VDKSAPFDPDQDAQQNIEKPGSNQTAHGTRDPPFADTINNRGDKGKR